MQGICPIYRTSIDIQFDQASTNAGLWYDKFCDRWCQDTEKTGQERWSLESFTSYSGERKVINPKMDWIRTVADRIGNSNLLSEANRRISILLYSYTQSPIFFRTSSPFVTGIGRNHPVENGFVWHHVLGVPYLPGSSVKGIVRSWATCWENWILEDDKIKTIKRIFGPRDSKDHRVGSVIFLDALPTRPVQLKADVMTPHYGPYYQKDEPPADWHRPVPIPFLVVAEGQEFQFALMPRRPCCAEDEEDARKAKQWLVQALEYIGAGAKTAVGYGRFELFVPILPKSRGEEWLQGEVDRLAKVLEMPHSKILGEKSIDVAKSWNKIEDPDLKTEVLNEIRKKYADAWKRPWGGLKKAKKEIYEVVQNGASKEIGK